MNNSVTVDFSVLSLIPKIAESIEQLKKENEELKQHFNPKYDLTKRAGVKKYLNISDSSIAKYLREGIFRQGYHYHREIKNNKSIIVFVSGAIEEFKKSKEKWLWDFTIETVFYILI